MEKYKLVEGRSITEGKRYVVEYENGVLFYCPCGERPVGLSTRVHTISFPDGLLHVEPSCGYHEDKQHPTNWCHFYIKNGIPKMCGDSQCPGKELIMDNPFGDPPAELVVAKKVEEDNVAKVAEVAKKVEEEKNDQDEQVEPDPSEEQEQEQTPDYVTQLIHACHHLQHIDEVAQSHTEIEEAKFEIIRLARELPRD